LRRKKYSLRTPAFVFRGSFLIPTFQKNQMDELNAVWREGRERRHRLGNENAIVKDVGVTLTSSKRNLTNEEFSSAEIFEKINTKKHKHGRSLSPPESNSVADIALRHENGETHWLTNQAQLSLGHTLTDLRFGKSYDRS
jgi:hypothetical protein